MLKPQCYTTDIPRDRQEDVTTQKERSRRDIWMGMVAHDFRPCALEAGAGRLVCRAGSRRDCVDE